MRFIQFLNDIFHSNFHNNYVFRGQADTEWELLTSYARFFNKTQNNSAFSLEIFTKMLTQFIDTLSEFKGIDYSKIPTHQKIALAQHYGLPTPFLDWSSSPFIAIYFAALDNIFSSQKNSIAIYSLDTSSFEENGYNFKQTTDELLIDNNIYFRFIKTNNFYSKRISNQQGCFTYHNTVEAFDKNIQKYCIEDDFFEIFKNLRLMGINSCNLFDDIDYISKDIITKFIIKKL